MLGLKLVLVFYNWIEKKREKTTDSKPKLTG